MARYINANLAPIYLNADACEQIKYMPSEDVVEVVYCKDCKFRKTEDCAMYYKCNCGEQHTWENDNDFCSYGQRKDKESEDT